MTEYGPLGSKYQTNFSKFDEGNGIEIGTELLVKIIGAESVTGQIRDSNNKVILIDQSSISDEDQRLETVNFILKRKGMGYADDNLPAGEYKLVCWYWDNDSMTGGSYTDKFLIVAKN